MTLPARAAGQPNPSSPVWTLLRSTTGGWGGLKRRLPTGGAAKRMLEKTYASQVSCGFR